MSDPPGSGAAPSVVIADDHPATRLGVRMALMRGGFDVVAEAADFAESSPEPALDRLHTDVLVEAY